MRALTVSTLSRFIFQFGESSANVLREMGFDVHIAANFKEDLNVNLDNGFSNHHIDFNRNPIHPDNIRAYRQLCGLMREHSFDLVYCQTPVAAWITRLAAFRRGIKPVIYMAHGFHFYQGAPALHKFFFKGLEQMMARLSNAIITINQEDFSNAYRFRLRKGGKVYKVHGAGVEFTEEVASVNLRQELGLTSTDKIVLSLGELNKNKNHVQIIKALSLLPEKDSIHYVIGGKGKAAKELEAVARARGVHLHLLGFRRDALGVLREADLFAFPSYREGLSKALMEAMSLGVPIAASKIRGNVDLIEDGVNGMLFACDDLEETAGVIQTMLTSESLQAQFAAENAQRIQRYKMESVKQDMRAIYAEQIAAHQKIPVIDLLAQLEQAALSPDNSGMAG